jgi:hypothetical protein
MTPASFADFIGRRSFNAMIFAHELRNVTGTGMPHRGYVLLLAVELLYIRPSTIMAGFHTPPLSIFQ